VFTVVAVVALLFPGTGSTVVADAVAVFVRLGVANVGLTTIVRTAFAPFASAPIVHVTVPEAFVQPALADTNVTPPGSGSVIVTPAASEGPLFVTVNV
jgi:hypothetical protein